MTLVEVNAKRLAAGEPLPAAEPLEALRLVTAVLAHVPALIGYWDRQLRNRLANAAYRDFFGKDPEQMHGIHIREVLGEALFDRNLPYMQAALAGEPQLFDRTITDPNGVERHTQASYIPYVADGEVEGFFVLVTDITARKEAEAALQELETDRAAAALAGSEQRGRYNALLLASAGEGIYSLDTYGVCTSINPAAARLLGYEVSELVGAPLHDRIHHTHADGSPHPAAQCEILSSVQTGEGVRVEGDVLWRRNGTMLSVDYSSFPIMDDGVVRGAVVNFADVTDREASRVELASLASEMRRGIAAGEFVLHYQPKLDLVSGQCEAVEALVRWQRGDTLAFPDDFILAAEQTGAIHDLTIWVITEAVRQAAAWRQDGRSLRIAVNVSSVCLHQHGFAEHLAAAAARAGIPASCIEVELTETTLAQNIEPVLRNLAAFTAMAVRSAIDDFGTGFSSLSYLKELPMTYLKIDKSFVINMPRDTRDQAIVAATIHLAHSLGLRVVAEGVENDFVLRHLRDAGCDFGQGYHWTRALPAAQCEQWLDEHHAATHTSTPPR